MGACGIYRQKDAIGLERSGAGAAGGFAVSLVSGREREQRDKTVNTLCAAAAGLRLVRVPGNVTMEELIVMLGGAW